MQHKVFSVVLASRVAGETLRAEIYSPDRSWAAPKPHGGFGQGTTHGTHDSGSYYCYYYYDYKRWFNSRSSIATKQGDVFANFLVKKTHNGWSTNQNLPCGGNKQSFRIHPWEIGLGTKFYESGVAGAMIP